MVEARQGMLALARSRVDLARPARAWTRFGSEHRSLTLPSTNGTIRGPRKRSGSNAA